MRPLAHCHLGIGKLYQRTGKRQEAPGTPDHCDDDVPRDGMTYWLEQAEREFQDA
jgi:hypothetical protein